MTETEAADDQELQSLKDRLFVKRATTELEPSPERDGDRSFVRALFATTNEEITR